MREFYRFAQSFNKSLYQHQISNKVIFQIRNMKSTQELSDKLAIGVSIICTLNCLLLPSILVLSSGYLATQIDSEIIHAIILLLAIPLSTFALWRGYKNHNNSSLFLVGVTGLVIMVMAYYFGENLLGEFGEQFFTLFGSAVVVYAHYKNYRTCNDLNCECHNLDSS